MCFIHVGLWLSIVKQKKRSICQKYFPRLDKQQKTSRMDVKDDKFRDL